VQTGNARTVKSLSLKLIIKSIVLMNAAELQQTKELWKSIMKKKLLEMAQVVDAKNVVHSLVDITTLLYVLPVKRK
jgi:hypothetical protein